MTEPERDPLLTPPDATEVGLLARGVVSAVGGAEHLTDLQALLIRTLFHSMTGHDVDPTAAASMDAERLAAVLARRTPAFRTRILQVALLVALVVRPLPLEVAQRLRSYATAMGVRDDMVDVAERFADGALELAQVDFDRNGYLGSLAPRRLEALHTHQLETSWGMVADDPALADRWTSLGELPVGTLGRGVHDFYLDRGFVFPGLPGSAPPLLAQHDWVHVLAGYGTALENEIEVFAFMARANDDPRAFSLLAMVVSLFETGYLTAGAGLFEADAGHLSAPGMSSRLADAMRRGALTRGSHDFLDLDFFARADRPIAVVRADIGLVDKAAEAVRAGSVGPWELGGITPFQLEAAARAAAQTNREYRPWSPDLSRT